MSKGYRLAAVAFGLALPFHAPAQEVSTFTLENQPTTERNSTPEQNNPLDLIPVIKSLEGAIRDLKPAEDAAERERKEQREIRDLAAQQEMAFWAEAMFWTTFATVILTAFGIILIGLTLIYTRKAAESAVAAVDEAKEATKAAVLGAKEAREATAVARMSYEADVRPLLKIAITDHIIATLTQTTIKHEARIDVLNVGKGVATDVVINCVLLRYEADLDPSIVAGCLDAWGLNGEGRGFAIFPSDGALGRHHIIEECIDENNPVGIYARRSLALLVMVAYKGAHTNRQYFTTQAYAAMNVTAEMAASLKSDGGGSRQNLFPAPLKASVIVI